VENRFIVNWDAKTNLATMCFPMDEGMVYPYSDCVFGGREQISGAYRYATAAITTCGISKRAGESVVQALAFR
jgi:dTDP-4-dehydrorhamnose reductase